eukprot:6108416-Pyramimonas_sp.AAC.1
MCAAFEHGAQLAHQAGVEGLGISPRVDVALAARRGRTVDAPSEQKAARTPSCLGVPEPAQLIPRSVDSS